MLLGLLEIVYENLCPFRCFGGFTQIYPISPVDRAARGIIASFVGFNQFLKAFAGGLSATGPKVDLRDPAFTI